MYIDRKHHNILTLQADININVINIFKCLILKCLIHFQVSYPILLLAHKLAISCCSHQLAQWHGNSHLRLKLNVTPGILPALPKRKISHTVKYCWNCDLDAWTVIKRKVWRLIFLNTKRVLYLYTYTFIYLHCTQLH